jgi:Fe-S cluster assembly iron-binding protein IscA
MLALTSSAAQAIRGITSVMPEAAGIRLARLPGLPENGWGPATNVEAQPAPAPDLADAVLNRDHASVFIDPALVESLADKVLDAEIEGAQTTFVLRERGA